MRLTRLQRVSGDRLQIHLQQQGERIDDALGRN